ncbi:MAG: carbohydrate binding family 9 domain-containing protein [Gemmatimonadaceae bacterium]|nr:carbohydrate binding family 9 domain-containing protein [Gemmatimonadaceae bacterium]
MSPLSRRAATLVAALTALVCQSAAAQSTQAISPTTSSAARPAGALPRPSVAFIAEPGRAEASRTSMPIELDGKLDEAAWTTARYVTGLTQREPSEGSPASDSTRVTFVYDNQALYIGARMHSSNPQHIRPLVARRDKEGSAEQLVLSFDTFGDRRTAYTFSVTSGGVRVDYYHGSDFENSRDYTFDPVWEVRTTVDAQGWTAEMRIPFSQLRFSAADEQIWGVNIVRLVPEKNESDYWMLVKRNETGWSSRMGQLTGIRGVKARQRLEVLPYVASDTRAKSTVNTANPYDYRQRSEMRAGADVKIGLGPNATLEATINPDFGQVEADPAVVNLSAFEVFFQERRPFFTEGTQLLNARGNFYSRRIGAPPPLNPGGSYADVPHNTTILGAAKVSGRLPSKLSFAGLTALSAQENARVFDVTQQTETTAEVAPRTLYGIGVVQQEFGKDGSTAYAMFTGVERNLQDGSLAERVLSQRAYSGLADTRLRWAGGKYDVSAFVGFSHIAGDSLAMLAQQRSSRRFFQRPDAGYVRVDSGLTSMNGYFAGINHSKMSGSWLWDIDFSAESPGYEINDAGRLGGTDDLGQSSNLRYRQTQRGAYFHNWDVGVSQYAGWNFGGVNTYSGFELYSNQTLKNFIRTWVEAGIQLPAISDDLTRGGPMMRTYGGQSINAGISSRGGARTSWSLSAGTSASGDGGNSLGVDGAVTLRPGTRLELSITPSVSHNENARQYVSTRSGGTAATFGSRYIFAHVDQMQYSMRLRLNFALTPNLTFETYAEPFAASGRYHEYGELGARMDKDLRTYGTQGTTISAPDSTGARVVTDGAARFTLGNNDFNLRSFRSNAVMRWEWRPGCTLFVVWQQDRSAQRTRGLTVKPGALWDALSADGTQVLALKASYWLPLSFR